MVGEARPKQRLRLGLARQLCIDVICWAVDSGYHAYGSGINGPAPIRLFPGQPECTAPSSHFYSMRPAAPTSSSLMARCGSSTPGPRRPSANVDLCGWRSGDEGGLLTPRPRFRFLSSWGQAVRAWPFTFHNRELFHASPTRKRLPAPAPTRFPSCRRHAFLRQLLEAAHGRRERQGLLQG